MTQFTTPAGRLVQGGVKMQQQKDMETNQPLKNQDGTPQMGIFMSLAFPKVVNGVPNPEWAAFRQLMNNEAATAWGHLFPQGANGQCMNPRFSWKYQDGDGVDHNGQPVSGKPGFAGHHIVKFTSNYPVKCYNEGHFSPHEELQQPDTVIQRGDWVRIVGDMRGNNATGNQVPGISLYPSLVSWVGKDTVNGRITSGPDAQTAFGATQVGYVPPGVSTNPASTAANGPGVVVPPVTVPSVAVPQVAAAAPAPTPVAVVVPPPVQHQPQYLVAPQWAAQGVTLDAILAQGWTLDAAVGAGYLIKQ